MNFNEKDCAEITKYSLYKLNYTELYQKKKKKDLLLMYLSPIRLFIIPASKDYDIKELYLEIKNAMTKLDF